MRKKQMIAIAGFTLIEIMLVLVIISIIIWASVGYIQQRSLQMRMDRTSLQMQQILNAGMAYYVTKGNWPGDLDALKGTYLPQAPLRNPWNQEYFVVPHSQPVTPPDNPNLPMLYVYTGITQAGTGTGSAAAAANVIAGLLPMGYTSTDSGSPPATDAPCDVTSTTCYVVASVNIPGQELGNATAVNFAGLYRHGGCVPAPSCPTDPSGNVTMKAEVFVVPASVSGKNEDNTENVFPISSFTAYATRPAADKPLDTTPPNCDGTDGGDCTAENIGHAVSGYWRACLKVTTERGDVASTRTIADPWGQDVTLLAFTRCAISGEPSGSSFNVFEPAPPAATP